MRSTGDRPPSPIEVLIEQPISLGLALMATRQHGDQDLEQHLLAAASHGYAAAAHALQEEGGYARTEQGGFRRAELAVEQQLHETLDQGDTLLRLHAHLVVQGRTADGQATHMPAVARAAVAAQMRAVDATADQLVQLGIDVETSLTPAGRELVAFHAHARRIRRVMTCSAVVPVSLQVKPQDRYDTARAAG